MRCYDGELTLLHDRNDHHVHHGRRRSQHEDEEEGEGAEEGVSILVPLFEDLLIGVRA
jgi:hypothetical protein